MFSLFMILNMQISELSTIPNITDTVFSTENSNVTNNEITNTVSPQTNSSFSVPFSIHSDRDSSDSPTRHLFLSFSVMVFICRVSKTESVSPHSPFTDHPSKIKEDDDSLENDVVNLLSNATDSVVESPTEASVVSSLNDTDVNQSRSVAIVPIVIKTVDNSKRTLVKNNRGVSVLVKKSDMSKWDYCGLIIFSTVSTHRRTLPNTPALRSREKTCSCLLRRLIVVRKTRPQWFGPVEPEHRYQGKCPHCRLCVGSSPCVNYKTKQEGDFFLFVL